MFGEIAPKIKNYTLAKFGGFGHSMDMQSIATTGTINRLPAGFIKLTGSGSTTINGIEAPAQGASRWVYILSLNASTITFTNQSSSASANDRLINWLNNGNLLLTQNETICYEYDPVTLRWRYAWSSTKFFQANSPLSISSGALGIGQASGSSNGIISSSEWTNFRRAPIYTAAPTLNNVAYATGNTIPYSLGNNDKFNFNVDYVAQSLGVGLAKASVAATGHFRSDDGASLSTPGGISPTLVLFTPVSVPTSGAASATTPNLPNPSGPSTSINYAGSGYTANGDTLDYRVYPAYDDGMTVTYGRGYRFSTVTDNGSTNPYSVDLSWNADAGLITPNAWVVFRQINGGGYSDYWEVSTNALSDDNSNWTAGSPIGAQYPDFVANGTTYNFDTYGKENPYIDVYSSTSDSFSHVDSNDGETFLISISGNTSSTDVRVINGGATHYDPTVSVGAYSFNADINTFAAGATITPNNLGYLANGSNLNIDYNYYDYNSTLGIWSPPSTTESTIDPNDSSYYYVNLSPSTSSGKIIKSGPLGQNTTGTGTVRDDGITAFSSGTTVTPNSFQQPAGIWESHGSSVSDTAGMVSKSLDGYYSRFEFQSNTGAKLSYLEQTSSLLKIDVASGYAGLLTYVTGGRFKWDSTGIGFLGATPVAQQANTVDLGTVLSNFGLRASGTAYPITTSGAITFGSLTSTRIPIAGTAGLLGDDADLTFTGGDTLNVTKIVVGSGATITKLDCGTYTPTLTNTTNVAASTARQCTYMRVGSVVTVAGQLDIDPTAAGATLLGISLPIASALTTAYQLGGTACATGIAGMSAGIEADATNDRASLKYTAVDITNQTMTFQFTYEVL